MANRKLACYTRESNLVLYPAIVYHVCDQVDCSNFSYILVSLLSRTTLMGVSRTARRAITYSTPLRVYVESLKPI